MNADPIRQGWVILPEVSRSFTLCIKLLPGRLRDAVMMAYLLFRVADTIEDTLPTPESIRTGLQTFRRLLEHPDATALSVFTRDLLALTDDPAMQHLLRALPDLLTGMQSFPTQVQDTILERVIEMMGGMEQNISPHITTFDDQNLYCYYVAGTVGILLTDLFKYYGQISTEHRQLLEPYILDFGYGLQKVNIIKDFAHDRAAGKNYWPAALFEHYRITWKEISPASAGTMQLLEVMIRDACQHLDRAFCYILTLPRTAIRVRVFCLISLFMALESLLVCRQNPDIFNPDSTVKISRPTVYRIARRSFLFSSSNKALTIWFKKTTERFQTA